MANTSFGPYIIAANESNASRRMVYFSLFSASRETMPMTLGQLTVQPVLHIGGRAAISTASTVRAADAANGLYYLVLTQSETTAIGQAMLRMSNTSIPQTTVEVQFVAVDSGDSMRMGLFGLPNAAPAAAGGLPTFGTGAGQLNLSGGSVGLVPAVLSGVSVEVKTGGIQAASVGAGSYSGMSVEVKTGGIQVASVGKGAYSGVSAEVTTGGIQVVSIGKGNYSGVSHEIVTGGIQPASVGAGTYSSVTFQGLSNYANISNVTLAAGTHSNVTIQGISNYANISKVTLAAGTHSDVTIQGVSNYANLPTVTLAAATHSGATIQGVSNYANLPTVTLAAATHSGATVQGLSNYANISNVTLAVGTHSGATIQGVTRVNSAVTPADALYSAVTVRVDPQAYSGLTIQGVTRTLAVSAVDDKTGYALTALPAGTFSDTTVRVTGIVTSSFGAGAIDAAALATDAGQEIADRVLLRNVDSGSDGGRVVHQALAVLRNRVDASGSVLTVYRADDTTSAWTASLTTAAAASIVGVDPL